jgi:hypothetical protein
MMNEFVSNEFTMNEICSICLSEINPNITSYTIQRLDCGHAFHQHCIEPWLQTTNICPNCRVPTNLPIELQGNEILGNEILGNEFQRNENNHQYRISMSLIVLIFMCVEIIILYNLLTNVDVGFNAKIVAICVIVPFIVTEIALIVGLMLNIRLICGNINRTIYDNRENNRENSLNALT